MTQPYLPVGAAPGVPDSGIRILVVDDEPSVRRLLKRWIQRAFSIEVAEAENGLHALESLTTGDFDLVITDLNMPVLDGIEMLSLIRADAAHAQLEVIVASTVGAEEKVRAAISMGVADYLLKPLQHDLVVARINAAITRLANKKKDRSEDLEHLRTRVLIADRDPNFCEFACASLERQFSAQSVPTTAQALVKVLRWKPDAIVISPDLPGTPFAFLVEKIRSIAKPAKIAVFLLGETGNEQADCTVQGVVRRTFVPETFCSEMVSLLQGGAVPLHGILAWLPSIEPEVRSAIRQSFGMLAGGEPKPLKGMPPGGAPHTFAKVELTGASEGIRLRLGMRTSVAFVTSIVQAMTGEAGASLDEAAMQSGVQEVLNIVAGRIKSSCEGRQIELEIDTAEFASTDFGVIDEAIYERTFAYQWQDAHAFEMVLSAAATPAADEASPEQDASAAEGDAEASVNWEEAEVAATAETEP